jgi:hypothetical protein
MSIVILLSVIMLIVILLSDFRKGVTLLSSIMLIVTLLCHSDNCLFSQRCYSQRNYAYCHFAECHSAERRFAECHYPYCHFAYCHFAECHALCSLPSIMISVILQCCYGSVLTLSVIMLIAFMLNVIAPYLV